MNFLPKLLQCVAFIPGIVQAVEGLLANKSGADKKAAALSFVHGAVSTERSNIVDNDMFKDGLSKVIDGVVECLNASVWAKQQP